ncbi:MAG TPA: cell division protein ZapA [Nitrospirota bacterium]|nr:cell division protein ZapA [Nitrospirota bacterium]
MEPVQVEIYGQVYNLKGADNPAHIRELASFVDKKMKDIEKGTGTVDPHRVAILAALTIADELHSLRERFQALETTADKAVSRMLDMTETVEESK